MAPERLAFWPALRIFGTRNEAVLPRVARSAGPGTGIQDNLAYKARKLDIPVWKFGRGGA